MAEASNLIEKYSGAAGADATTALDVNLELLNYKPDWDACAATKSHSSLLRLMSMSDPMSSAKLLRQENGGIAQCLLDALGGGDEKLTQWILVFFYETMRGDGSSFSAFEDFKISGKPLTSILAKKSDPFCSDKAAWIATALMGHVPGQYTEAEVMSVLGQLLSGGTACTELGVLECIANLLKADAFRKAVWSTDGVADRIFKIQPQSDASNQVYRSIFAIWMLSFDKELATEFKKHDCLSKLKGVLVHSRTEKVVRITLTVLRNLLDNKDIVEEIVEENILDAVQQLEYEKWRDAELYDEIRDASQVISLKVQELSNFARYEKELATGKFTWSFIHTSKFWSENVNKFETNDFRALKSMAALLLDDTSDDTTKAVVCHDLGEFLTLHPLGKKKVAQLGVKQRVMQLMSSTNPNDREVRREALLCCQKMMLSKWQDIESSK